MGVKRLQRNEYPILALILAALIPGLSGVAVEKADEITDGSDPHFSFTRILVDDQRARPATFGLDAGLITDDAFMDIVAGKYFYKNPGGNMEGEWKRARLPGFPEIDAVLIVDVDDDEYGDLIALRLPDVFWLEAEDRLGESWVVRAKIGEIPLGPHGTSTQGFVVGQVIPGGKPEILLGSRGVFYLQIPKEPEAGDWPMTQVAASPHSEEGLALADINGNGHLDIVGCIDKSRRPNPVGWYENPGDGSGNWTYHEVGTTGWVADRFKVADINGDGRTDIVVAVANGKDDGVYWFECPEDPRLGDWTRHTIVVQKLANSMDVGDLNLDGFPDVVVGQHYTTWGNPPTETERKLRIFTNDGRGNFSEHLIDKGIESHLGARLFDLDGDGSLEIVNIGYSDYQYLHIWRNDTAPEISQDFRAVAKPLIKVIEP